MGKIIEHTLQKKGNPNAHSKMKRCSASLITGEIHLKLDWHFSTPKLAKRNLATPRASEDVEQWELCWV